MAAAVMATGQLSSQRAKKATKKAALTMVKAATVTAEAEVAEAEPKVEAAIATAADAKAMQAARVKAMDKIMAAAVKLTEATYPFMDEVLWNSQEFWLNPGTADAISWAKAIAKIIDMGASMDAELVNKGCEAHHNAIKNLPANGMCSEAKLTEIYAFIGCMIASVPESKTMEVYEAVKELVDPKVPEYLMSKVSTSNAQKAYAALLDFTEVVKANPITPSRTPSSVSSLAASSIGRAASKLGTAAYPFMQGVDWTDSLYATPVPLKSAQAALKACDTMIVMGTKMDGAALQEAAAAHVKAIENMDAKGVLAQKDFEAILVGLGKAISSAPASAVMDVYNEIGTLVGTSGIPAYLFSKQDPRQAYDAYDALMQFKDTVRAYQPDAIGVAAVKLSEATYPFMKEVPWNSSEFWLNPGKADAITWAKAIAKIIDMGAAMDMELVKAGCEAHHAAILDLPADGVCSQEKLTDIYASIGRMIASVPQSKTMDVYDALSRIVDPAVPAYCMSKVTEANARKAYDALIEFTQVVQVNSIQPSYAPSTVSRAAASTIDRAASQLAKSAYPFMQGVDWTDDLYQMPTPGKSAQETLKAIDKMIVMGTQMDGAALKEAGIAHVRAIAYMDKKGVLREADFEAILAGLGKAISSVPASSVMDVYDEMSKLVGKDSGVPDYLYSKQNPVHAMAAYSGLMQFKDAVRAHQPDEIGAAAAKLSNAAYPFFKQVPWDSEEFLLKPGNADAISWAKAVAKIIDMGASMDGELVKAGVESHHAAIKGLPNDLVCSQAQLTEMCAAIGRMIASVPESKTMGVYNAVTALIDKNVPKYLMSKVNEADAKAAYEALIEFTEVVKANPITPSTSATTVSDGTASTVSTAATKLASAAYPFMKGVDWTDDLYLKPIPGASARQKLEAVDTMLVMGAQMDWPALQEAAMAHVKAIENMDSKGLLTQQDFEATLAGLGKAISSVPSTSVMDVYKEISRLVFTTGIPDNLYSKQSAGNAMAAYEALMEFKDVVKEGQPGYSKNDTDGKWGVGLAVFLAALLPTFSGLSH